MGIGTVLGIVVGVVVSVLGVAFAGENRDTLYRQLEVLAETFAHIENHYVDDVPATQLVYGAAKGALAALDDHSAFFTPDEYRTLLDQTEGEYGGIGVELEMRRSVVTVAKVYEDTPAAGAGLKIGDQIVAVGGKSTADQSLDTVRAALRGPVGSKIRLTVRRRHRDDFWPFTLVRGWVRIRPISHTQTADGISIVRLRSFARRVAGDLRHLLETEAPRGGMVLDLRANPGGLFDEAVAVADLFIAKGVLVKAVGRGGRSVEEHRAQKQGTWADIPLATLIDPGSASAAEIVAGALKDHGRARLFGDRTFGKASVQSILDLSDGSGLKLTVARYYTPSGARIEGSGIEPHITVVQGGDRRQQGGSAAGDHDAVVDAALQWLRRERSSTMVQRRRAR